MKKTEHYCQQCHVLLPQDQFTFALITQTQTVAVSKTMLHPPIQLTYNKLFCPACASAIFLEGL